MSSSRGIANKNFCRRTPRHGRIRHCATCSRKEFQHYHTYSSGTDLTDQQAVDAFFENEKPQQVYLAAAKVGGIHANNTYRAQFLYENLMMEANVIHAAWKHGVDKLLFLGSSCIYPKLAPHRWWKMRC